MWRGWRIRRPPRSKHRRLLARCGQARGRDGPHLEQAQSLLVEDEEGLRALNARGLLASRGYTVLEAGNGIEAIEVLESSDRPVDIVVSDVAMPEMDGPEHVRELRTRNPNLKIIFVSGYAE